MVEFIHVSPPHQSSGKVSIDAKDMSPTGRYTMRKKVYVLRYRTVDAGHVEVQIVPENGRGKSYVVACFANLPFDTSGLGEEGPVTRSMIDVAFCVEQGSRIRLTNFLGEIDRMNKVSNVSRRCRLDNITPELIQGLRLKIKATTPPEPSSEDEVVEKAMEAMEKWTTPPGVSASDFVKEISGEDLAAFKDSLSDDEVLTFVARRCPAYEDACLVRNLEDRRGRERVLSGILWYEERERETAAVFRQIWEESPTFQKISREIAGKIGRDVILESETVIRSLYEQKHPELAAGVKERALDAQRVEHEQNLHTYRRYDFNLVKKYLPDLDDSTVWGYIGAGMSDDLQNYTATELRAAGIPFEEIEYVN